jgi:hypothetical protein
MTTEEIVQIFSAAKSGNGWIAKCPAHDDHNPSLCINPGRGGNTLVKCHAGCSLDQILPAVGLRKRDLFPDSMRLPAAIKPRFNWQKYVDAIAAQDIEQIAGWRGFSSEFVRELKDKGQIGIYDGLVAFPVEKGGQIVGAHIRMENEKWFYEPTGTHAAPMVFGQLGERVNVFESQWDAFALMNLSGERDGVIATCGAGNGALVAGRIPEGATVFLWPQNDELNPKTGTRPAEEWTKTVCEHIPKSCVIKRVKIPAHDLNDWMKAGGTVDDLIAAIGAAEVLREAERGLSFRSPEEILSMPRNPAANFLGDRLLGIALSLVIAGIGGIGKSRLFLQLLVDLILERIFCGIIETHHTKGKPWMLIQTQNPIARLQDDLERFKKYAESDWPLVEKNLIIHTLETDRDLMLHLSDPKNARDTESAIRERNPIGVAFDPLNEVAIGDLNKDQDMMATCSEIGRISRSGNPERAILIATHALTGIAGMKKAFGFEAAGFGRNSKVLQSWSRAFINVIPATEDFSVLLLTCGKNNNGKMFSPFAVRLNPNTMIYEPKPDFDIEEFREQLHSTQNTRQPLSPKIVAEIEWQKPELDKKQLVAAVREETGCSNATAYRLINKAVGRHIRFNKRTKIYAKK